MYRTWQNNRRQQVRRDKQNRMIHDLGEVATGDEIDPTVARLAGKEFKVVQSSSCIGCAFSGLGHRTCKVVQCSRYDRDDGLSVNYEEVQ